MTSSNRDHLAKVRLQFASGQSGDPRCTQQESAEKAHEQHRGHQQKMSPAVVPAQHSAHETYQGQHEPHYGTDRLRPGQRRQHQAQRAGHGARNGPTRHGARTIRRGSRLRRGTSSGDGLPVRGPPVGEAVPVWRGLCRVRR